MRKPTDKQRSVRQEGAQAEEVTKAWLNEHGFQDVERNPKPTGCWDIKARKGKRKWIIEVKTGENPKIDIANFEKMLKMKGFTKIGLALVAEDYVHLLEYPKMRFAAFKAWTSRRMRKKATIRKA